MSRQRHRVQTCGALAPMPPFRGCPHWPGLRLSRIASSCSCCRCAYGDRLVTRITRVSVTAARPGPRPSSSPRRADLDSQGIVPPAAQPNHCQHRRKVWQAKAKLRPHFPAQPRHLHMQCDRLRDRPQAPHRFPRRHQPPATWIAPSAWPRFGGWVSPSTRRWPTFEKIFANSVAWTPGQSFSCSARTHRPRRPPRDHRHRPRRTAYGRMFVTNGLRLADEAYCRKLCQAGVPVRFAFGWPQPGYL